MHARVSPCVHPFMSSYALSRLGRNKVICGTKDKNNTTAISVNI